MPARLYTLLGSHVFVVFRCPGSAMLITPGTPQFNLSVESRANCSPTLTCVVEPRSHGPVGTIAQGVAMPLAAAVRMAQVQNGGMLEPGLQSLMVAASLLSIVYLVWL